MNTPKIRRPVVTLALSAVAGTLAGLAFPYPHPWIYLLPLAAATTALFWRKHRRADVLIYGSVSLLFFVYTGTRVHPCDPRSVFKVMAAPMEYVQIRGSVVSDPERWQSSHDTLQTRLLLNLEEINRTGTWRRISGTCMVRMRGRYAADVTYGDSLQLQGRLEAEAVENLHRSARVKLEASRLGFQVLDRNGGSVFLHLCYRARAFCGRVITEGLDAFPVESGVLRALLLGYRTELPPDLRDLFARTGTLHIFAISGLHVGVMALLLVMVLRSTGLQRPYWFLVLAPVLFFYVSLTGMKPSALRAFIMAALYAAAFAVYRRPASLNALALAALVILAVDPLQITDLGFIMSFTIVTGLVVVYPRLRSMIRRSPDWMDAYQGPRSPIQRITAKTAGRAIDLVVTSVTAWLVSTPLTAYYFNMVSPVGLIGNILIIPFSFLIVLTGCLSLLFGSLFGLAAEIFNHANRLMISGMIELVHRMQSWPGSFDYISTPSPVAVLGWYVLLFVLISRWRLKTKALIILPVVLAVTVFHHGLGRSERFSITVLDVGQGTAVLASLPGGEHWLIDAGPNRASYRVERALKTRGIRDLERLILTHADSAHAGGASQLLEHFNIASVYISPYSGRSRTYRRTLQGFETAGIPVFTLHQGDEETMTDHVFLECLHPPEQGLSKRAANDQSLVLRLSHFENAVLFMGGADEWVEDELLQQGGNVAAPVLIIGDHGSAATCSEGLLDAVDPHTAVISAGAGNLKGLPDPSVISRLRKAGVNVCRTDQDGNVELRFHSRAGIPDQDVRLEVSFPKW